MSNTAMSNMITMTVGALSMLLCAYHLSAYSTSSSQLFSSPVVKMVSCEEVTTTSKLVILSEKNWITESSNVFPNARKFTPEEAIEYKTALKQVYKPIGRNRFM